MKATKTIIPTFFLFSSATVTTETIVLVNRANPYQTTFLTKTYAYPYENITKTGKIFLTKR